MSVILECLRLDLEDPGIGLSPTMAEAMVASRAAPAACEHRPTLALVRRQRPYALLGPRDLRLPRPKAGVEFLVRRGLPVYRRLGGGSLVVLDEDCLSFALAWPCRNPAHAGQSARALAPPVLAALSALGVQARMGAAVGSYCAGPSDLVVGAGDGRKVAGMALALRGGWALVSGMLLVRQNPAYVTGLIAGFEAAAGRYTPLRRGGRDAPGGRRGPFAARGCGGGRPRRGDLGLGGGRRREAHPAPARSARAGVGRGSHRAAAGGRAPPGRGVRAGGEVR